MTETDPIEPAVLGPERPSKTQRKQQAHDLQDLGKALSTLPAASLDALPLGDALRDALAEYRRIRAHEGKRRQLQLLGKLMRQVESEPIREAVAAYQLGPAGAALDLHRLERWRRDLVTDDAALTRWMNEHPQTDVQHLRSLVRAARKDALLAPEQRHGKAWREIFLFIKQHPHA